MKISDVKSGRTYLVEIEQSDRSPFLGLGRQSIQNEVSLYRSETTGEILLKNRDEVWSIEGTDKEHKKLLSDVMERNLPLLCWIAAIFPKTNSPERLKIQVHEFPHSLYLQEEIAIGIDEKIIDDIRDRYIRKAVPVSEILKWLTNKVLIPSPADNRMQRVLMQAGQYSQSGLETTFRLCGKDIAVNVRRTPDDKLIIDRVVRARQNQEYNEQRPIILVRGNFSFCDFSIAGSLRSDAKTELDTLVESSNSYLAIWEEYNQIEKAIILQNAQQVSWMRYTHKEILSNGDYRFHLQSKTSLNQQLQILRESPQISLEASSSEPNFSCIESNYKNGRTFFGQVVDINWQRLTLDIRPSNLDEEEDLNPPSYGFLFVSLQGDRTRLRRRTKAEEKIRTASCPMPQLGLILENQSVPIRRIRNYKPLTKDVLKIFDGFRPTRRQEEAIRVAINTPDIALIQGPPGTGKTKVITAIQARLAEIAEDAGSSIKHKLLLTSYQHDAVETVAEKTNVFGLPAVRIGGRMQQEGLDNVDRWRRVRIEALEAKLGQLPEQPESENLRTVRNWINSYLLTPGDRHKTAQLLQNIFEVTQGKIENQLSDRLFEFCHQLKQKPQLQNHSDEQILAIKAIKSLRTDAVSFCDDGAINARKVIYRLEPLNLLDTSQKQLLEQAADWCEESEPPFLEELEPLKRQLLDLLIPAELPVVASVTDPEIEELLTKVKDSFYNYVCQSTAGTETVLFEYLEDLKTDPRGVREMLQNYTVVLAATCQQSAGNAMKLTTGNDDSVFETVIIDEAARANPLDLFIPLSKAERRIILVGDHRQLPHILEEDVERQLSQSRQSTQDALKKSLFERLFNQLKERERTDGIKRTVTLDTQYRMHPILGEFVSKTFYEYHGEPPIEAGQSETAFVHNLPDYQDTVAAWINVPFSAGAEVQGKSKSRTAEAKRIARELKRMIEHNSHLTFGIITFYSAQVKELWKELCKVELAEQTDEGIYQVSSAWRETRNHEGKIVERLRVGTVDSFQGKEFDVVFLSITRSNLIKCKSESQYHKKYGFLMLENRLCVAMSRQKCLLIAVGDLDMVRTDIAPQAIPQLVSFYQFCQNDCGKIFNS
ncbi:AAA domain-containing protein [Lyngbya sp. CCY1209]|uniref:DEAD/DEAH box helicase n=1 Tax=Lyngbya sp. CCY1209 TaxID=2886103 RepID=UPI002D205442|nr:AAA domain-containing protein [Lyngbya sp. CCY1209]MEB3882004.1 AAA domain-containing protein [Lyngbya sp. CCY1209]